MTTMPIADVLSYCADRRLSGTLRCECGPHEKTITIRTGNAVRASSNDPREYLGQFLINHGHIGEEQLDQAFETQRETKVFLGRILVMIGLVEEKTIREMLALKLRETVLSLLLWEHGQFHLSPEETPDTDPTVDIQVPLTALVQEAEQRHPAWEDILRVFPHGDLHLEVSPDDLPERPEHPLDERIIDLAIGGQTVSEIELSLHATPFILYRRLLSLHEAGALKPVAGDGPTSTAEDAAALEGDALEDLEVEVELEVGGRQKRIPGTLGEEVTIDEIVKLARDFLAKGRCDHARAIASRAVELAPHDAGANTALKEAETALLAELRQELLEGPVIPHLAISKQDLKKRRLTPAERYLLKRFDGTKSLSTVLRVSPIKEVEALKIVSDMLAAGVVRLRPE